MPHNNMSGTVKVLSKSSTKTGGPLPFSLITLTGQNMAFHGMIGDIKINSNDCPSLDVDLT